MQMKESVLFNGNLLFADLTVTVQHERIPNTYRIKVEDGEWREVEASLEASERGLRLNTLIGDKKSNVGLLTHEHQVHVYDEVANCRYIFFACDTIVS